MTVNGSHVIIEILWHGEGSPERTSENIDILIGQTNEFDAFKRLVNS